MPGSWRGEGKGSLGHDGCRGHKDNGAPDGTIDCLFGEINTLMGLQVTFPALVETLTCNIKWFYLPNCFQKILINQESILELIG